MGIFSRFSNLFKQNREKQQDVTIVPDCDYSGSIYYRDGTWYDIFAFVGRNSHFQMLMAESDYYGQPIKNDRKIEMLSENISDIKTDNFSVAEREKFNTIICNHLNHVRRVSHDAVLLSLYEMSEKIKTVFCVNGFFRLNSVFQIGFPGDRRVWFLNRSNQLSITLAQYLNFVEDKDGSGKDLIDADQKKILETFKSHLKYCNYLVKTA